MGSSSANWLSPIKQMSPQSEAVLQHVLSGAVQDVVALIAYEQPEQSPLAHLLDMSQREVVADAVNAAILQVATTGSDNSTEAAAGSSRPQVGMLG